MTWFRSAMVIVLSTVAIVVVVVAIARSVQEAAVFGMVLAVLVAAYLIRARGRFRALHRNRRVGED